MRLDAELRIIHEPVRLRIMGLLYRENDLGFTTLRDALDVTQGNLGSHLAKLESAGFVKGRDALGRDGFERRIAITAEGAAAFGRYLAELEAFMADQPAERPDPPAPVAPRRPEPAPDGAARKKATRIVASVGGLFVVGEAAQQFLTETSGSSYGGILASAVVLSGIAAIMRGWLWHG